MTARVGGGSPAPQLLDVLFWLPRLAIDGKPAGELFTTKLKVAGLLSSS